jgi:glutamate N-acetyltransferase/amino-acid N-acetyltransferase
VVKGIEENAGKLSGRQVAGSLASNAILTTDTFAKEGFLNFEIDGKQINLAGMAKGSGMIHPDMGTMLCFIACDIDISSTMIKKALKKVVDKTFNMISVDGDTSTNDMVAIMCNGKAGNKPITRQSMNYKKFERKLEELCSHLAKLIVSDGEGSSKFIEYRVVNAPNDADARQVVRTISDSCLVKTAMFGSDPNWGRIVAAAGRSGVSFNPDKISLSIGDRKKILILDHGQPANPGRASLKKKMRSTNIVITLDLNNGDGEAVGWGTDLSYEYVRINAEYET